VGSERRRSPECAATGEMRRFRPFAGPRSRRRRRPSPDLGRGDASRAISCHTLEVEEMDSAFAPGKQIEQGVYHYAVLPSDQIETYLADTVAFCASALFGTPVAEFLGEPPGAA
jgi:hypothetical protein